MTSSKSIWKKPVDIAELNKLGDKVAVSRLGIRLVEIGPDFVVGTMEVNAHTHQPFGLLHGGVSCVLAETLGSIGAQLAIDEPFMAVGTDINASHLRGVRSGVVTGTARPVKIGRSMHWWGIDIVDENSRLICTARLTVAIIKP